MKKSTQRKFKVCTDCKTEKKLEEFYKQTSPVSLKTHDGYRTECKKCHNKKTRKRALRFRESTLEYQRNYYRTVTKP